jgi:hypothetical protein
MRAASSPGGQNKPALPGHPKPAATESKFGGVEDQKGDALLSPSPAKRNQTKKIILLGIGLVGALSICSVGWMAHKRSASGTGTKMAAVQEDTAASKNIAVPGIDGGEQDKNTRKNWRQYITAENSNYAYGILGGINNLSVLFTNRTGYSLDEVTAKITYIKSNGKPWKVKYISVFNLPPHSEKKQALAKVNRGKSVQVSISKVVSKKMHFNYTAGVAGKDPGDPYYME